MTILAGILMLGILVFVHEFGHFCIAKLMNVKVLAFSLGFGPRLLAWRWGETEYRLCAIPLGGYVQMLGENPDEEEDENKEDEELQPGDEKRSFAKKSPWQRIAIVLAGPAMNLLLPLFLLSLAYWIGVPAPAYLEQPPVVGHVSGDSEAQKAGFRAGDRIVALNGVSVDNWEKTSKIVVEELGKPLRFTVRRENTEFVLEAKSSTDILDGLQAFGLLPEQEARVGALAPNSAAASAGLQAGDLILKINDRPVTSWYDLRPLIQNLREKPGKYLVARGNERLEMTLWAKKVAQENGPALYQIGVAPSVETTIRRFALPMAMREGGRQTWELAKLTFIFVKKLIMGEVSAKNIGGPITVVQVAGTAARTDATGVLTILAFLSIQLGILNLLPIPVLDGGHILFSCCEIVLGRPVTPRFRELAQRGGLIFLLLLMCLAFYNDLVRLFWSGNG
ncbi:MAG: RIP metalloprotease RseP [Deltaproteobacteria bacterium]|nr:RIP metalloprotease RseP [Deltaproteobacteria bacterium]